MKRYLKDAPRNIREEQKSLADYVYDWNYLDDLGLTEEEIQEYFKKENKRK